MANNKEVDVAVSAVIELSSALQISEKDLVQILEECIVYNNGDYSDFTINIVSDIASRPEFNIK